MQVSLKQIHKFRMNRESSDKRGAALILEIIIYLVIVALIAVAVTSGVRAIRDLVFASHARGDVANVHSWMEGKYVQDNKYPGVTDTSTQLLSVNFPDMPQLTVVGAERNFASIRSINGSGSGYCIVVQSSFISDSNKTRFWSSSANPSKIMQKNTATDPTGGAGIPDSGIPGLTCPG